MSEENPEYDWNVSREIFRRSEVKIGMPGYCACGSEFDFETCETCGGSGCDDCDGLGSRVLCPCEERRKLEARQ